MSTTIIRNGRIIDPTNKRDEIADLYISNGKVVGSKSEIHALMQELAERGLAVLMISSELPEILGMSDRIAVMRGGTIAGVLTREEATQERVLAMALGH